jgi:hypothetical protein
MRSLRIAGALLVLLPAVAAAKTGLVLDPFPYGLQAGDPWDVQIRYIRSDVPADAPNGRDPSIRITRRDSGTTVTFPMRREARGSWRARVVYPSPGVWLISVRGFGASVGQQSWDPVTITARRQTPAAPRHTRASSVPFGLLGAGSAAALLAACVLGGRMRRSRT